MKTQLYDIYVDNQNVTAHVPAMQELLKVSDADRDKYQKLNNQRYVCKAEIACLPCNDYILR